MAKIKETAMVKKKTIADIQSELNAEFKNKSLVQTLIVNGAVTQAGVSTGSMIINEALSGSPFVGFVWGRMIEVYGPEQSGKTTLALHTLVEAQRLGVPTAFIDAEHALDPVYAESLGVNFKDMLFVQPDSGEQALEVAEAMAIKGVKFIVIDSVASLVPQAEIDGDMGDSHMGLQARLMSQACRKLVPILSKTQCTILFINQIRMKIGVMFGNPEVTSGGNALKFYASYRLECRSPRGGAKNKKTLAGVGVEEEEIETSIVMNVKTVKNKLYPPFKKVAVTIEYGEGFDKFRDAVTMLERMGAFEVVTEGKNKGKAMLAFPECKKIYTAGGLLIALRRSEKESVIRTEIVGIIKMWEEKNANNC